MRLRPAFLSLAVLLVAACATNGGGTATGSAEDEVAIRAMADEWAAKYNARDAAGIAAMMASNYHEVTPTGEHLSTVADAQAMIERDFAQMPPNVTVGLTTEYVEFLGADAAFAGGTYTSAGMPEGMPTRGSWLVVFSRDTTGWKMASGLGSADLSYMMAAEPAADAEM